MDQKKSNFSGFLDGYKAGNLASMSSIFRVKREEIKEHINNCLQALQTDKSDESHKLRIELSSLKSILLSDLESLNVLIALGESLNSIIASFKSLSPASQQLVIHDLKKIVYHFIDLAKKSEDQSVIELAINIGEGFSFA